MPLLSSVRSLEGGSGLIIISVLNIFMPVCDPMQWVRVVYVPSLQPKLFTLGNDVDVIITSDHDVQHCIQ